VLFASDLLPADLTGLRLFDESAGAFRFEPEPVFAQVLLADEINTGQFPYLECSARVDGQRPRERRWNQP